MICRIRKQSLLGELIELRSTGKAGSTSAREGVK